MTADELMRLRALRDIARRLDSQSQVLGELEKQSKRRGWLFDFSSNIAGNAVWDGAVYLFRMLARKL